jgi:folate-binding protein YgfZ
MNNAIHGIASLPHWGVIRAQGDDAAKFLQGQLTQDFLLLGPGQARLAGFCSAKGRLQASFIGFKQSPIDILLVCSRDILAATLKRLSMFVMRAKVKLSDASEDFALFGLMGDPATALVANHPAWNRLESGQASIVVLYPAAGQTRALWVAPVGDPKPVASPISTELWQWSEVQSGIAMISTPIVEAFVPQMLNYESVGGVNFKKGCYPGQEVVARSQFRGTLKRGAFLVRGDAGMVAGQEVFHSGDAEQACGTVALAAAAPGGGFDALVSMLTSAAESGQLHLGSPQGPLLMLAELPYPLLADI